MTPSWVDAVDVWRVDRTPDGVTVQAALALVYCPVAMSLGAWGLLAPAPPAIRDAVVGCLLRSARQAAGAVPLGGIHVGDREVQDAWNAVMAKGGGDGGP